jgi:hypothetical protein
LILLNKIGSLDLQNIAEFCSQMCTDTPLVPARLYPSICLVIPAQHPPCACLRCRIGSPSATLYCHAILSSARLVVRVDNLPCHTCVTGEKGVSRLSCSMADGVFTRLLALRPLSQAYFCMTLRGW